MKLSNKPTYIYILYDPTFISTKLYVGKTEQKPAKRLSGHLKKSNLQKNYFSVNWIKSLLARNIKPAMYIFTIIPPGQDWESAEKLLIAFLRWCGIEITNITDGGESGKPAGWHHTVEAKEKMSVSKKGKSTWNKGVFGLNSGMNNNFFGKKHSIETRKIMSQKAASRKHSEDSKLKMSIARKGKIPIWMKQTVPEVISQKMKRNVIGEQNPAAKINKEQVIEIRKLYASGDYTFVDLAKLFNISNVSITNIVRRKTWQHIP